MLLTTFPHKSSEQVCAFSSDHNSHKNRTPHTSHTRRTTQKRNNDSNGLSPRMSSHERVAIHSKKGMDASEVFCEGEGGFEQGGIVSL